MHLKKIIIINILLLTIILIIAIFSYQGSVIQISNFVKQETTHASKRAATSLSYPVWNLNNEEINKIMEFILLEEDLSAIILKDSNYNFIAAKKADKDLGTITLEEDYHIDCTKCFKTTAEVYRDEVPIGFVEVISNENTYAKEVKSAVTTIIAYSLLSGILTALGSMVYYQRKQVEQILIENNKKLVEYNKNLEKTNKELAESHKVMQKQQAELIEQKSKYEAKNKELEKFMKLTVNRELVMIDLKKKLEETQKKMPK